MNVEPLVHSQKWELAFLQTVFLSILNAMTTAQRENFFSEFDKAAMQMEAVLETSGLPDKVLSKFRDCMETLDEKRNHT